MPSPRLTTDEEIQALAELGVAEDLFNDPDRSPSGAAAKPWEPDLNPTQKEIFNDNSPFILAYGEKGCRTLDTLICTDHGVVRLGDLEPRGAQPGFNPISRKVWASQSDVATADAYWVETDRSAIRIELANGSEITGSPRHPIWACESKSDGTHDFRWVRFDELGPLVAAGHRFWTPLTPHPSWDQPDELDLDLCYALGALTGDGGLNFDTGDNRSVGFTNVDKECIDRVNIGLSVAGCRLNQSKSQSKVYQYSVLPRKPIVDLLRGFGLVGLANTKRIPRRVISAGKHCTSAYLRGLFDTDGTVEKAGTVSFCTTSEALGRDVQDILAVMGILSSRRPKKSSSGKPTWTLSVMGRHAFRFGQVVGFEIGRKQARIRGQKVSKLAPDGWNSNRYGYPDPIRSVMRLIALSSRTGIKKAHAGKIHRDRTWHNGNRKLHSFGSVPQRPKVELFKSVYGRCEQLDPFIAADNWLEVVSVSVTTAELADIRVPGPHSFIASGTLNHNSGKSIGGEHKLVRHVYENFDALGLIFTPSIRTGRFGAVHDLESLVLPAWTDGIGLDWVPSRLDPQTKDRVIKVGNRFGGWSTILQISIPYEAAIAARIKGVHPSFILGEELTDCEGEGYFRLMVGQLNRRRHITGPQQFVASCNPKGPSNWVHKVFFEDPFDHATGKSDSKFKTYHVPFRENAHRPEVRGYLETLEAAVKGDPIERARLIEGRWVERPTGMALFKDYFDHATHVIGDIKLGIGLTPLPNLPVVIGYDIGQVFNAAVFLQRVPTATGTVWVVFDEVIHIKERILYRQMAQEIIEKIKMWNEHAGMPLAWEHVTDDSATTQWRPGDGSLDAWAFEREFNRFTLVNGLPQMKMTPCPKGAGSVETRVRIVQGNLHNNNMLISATCPYVQESLLMLEAQKGEELRPKKTAAGHIHVFDALSYPMLKIDLAKTMASFGAAIAILSSR